MSAAEIVEMIEKLPPEQRAEVYALLEQKKVHVTERKIRYIPDEKFANIAPKIFEQHHELFRRLAE